MIFLAKNITIKQLTSILNTTIYSNLNQEGLRAEVWNRAVASDSVGKVYMKDFEVVAEGGEKGVVDVQKASILDIFKKSQIIADLKGSKKVIKYFFLQQARYFWFDLLLLFVVCLLETNQIFSRINNLTIQTRTTSVQNKYSYLNAVKRSINTSSAPLIILINESRLRLHS